MRRLLVVLTIAAGLVLVGSSGRGHGGLPVSEQLVFSEESLVVPTASWGAFIAPLRADRAGAAAPFRWLCDEAIGFASLTATHRWVRSASGALFVTDARGLRVSRDGGCSWTEGGPGPYPTSTLLQRGAALFVVTFGAVGPNALWRSTDDGATWSALFTTDEYLDSVALSDDAQHVWLSGSSRLAPSRPLLWRSHDGGATVVVQPLDLSPLGAAPPRLVRPLAVDTRHGATDGRDLYLAALTDQITGNAVIHTRDGGATLSVLLETPAALLDVVLRTDEVWVVTSGGLFRGAPGGGALRAAGDLGQPRCLVEEAGALWACGSDGIPDFRVVSRSTDDGARFSGLFRFAETAGPLACPAQSEVAKICPPLWSLYAERLGVPRPDAGVPSDLGPLPPTPRPATGCSVRGF